MRSQVSFKFDGHHNVTPVLDILRNKLPGLKHKLELSNGFYTIYVRSSLSKEQTFHACYGIQCFVIYDETREV